MLNQTAQKLGVSSSGGGINVTYAPQIYTNDSSKIKSSLDTDFERFKEWIKEYFNDKDRGDF